MAKHRPIRERKDVNRNEALELKKENEMLRRQVSRLHKENARLQAEEPDLEEETETNAVCPKCGSDDLGEIVTPGGKKIVSCCSCRKWRSRPI